MLRRDPVITPLFTLTDKPDSVSAPTDADPLSLLGGALAGFFTVRQVGSSTQRLTHLDTPDRRLARAGWELLLDSATRRLLLYRSGSQSSADNAIEQQLDQIRWPVLARNLPDGPVVAEIRPAAWIRAIAPFATSRVRTTTYAVENAEAKTIARLAWHDGALVKPTPTTLAVRLTVERLRGYGDEAARVERLLEDQSALRVTTTGWLEAIRAVPALAPRVRQRFGMRRDQAADLAVADALLGFLDEMEEVLDGVIVGLDTEYLHDFRVAVRRSRSVLKLLGGVLPDGLSARVAPELRWFGDVTTPTRDLDVFLLEVDDLSAAVHHPDDLRAFTEHLIRRRSATQKELARALRSPRFGTFRLRWREELGAVLAAPSGRGGTAAMLADERLHRTFRRVTKRARAITEASPSDDIHALRKTCKEMRYLLEVFRPLCHPKAYKQVIADFREIQDVLGQFQDGEVQAAALRELAQEMLEGGGVRADVILAMGELSGRFEDRQRAARETLVDHRRDYLGPRARAHLDRLLPDRQAVA